MKRTADLAGLVGEFLVGAHYNGSGRCRPSRGSAPLMSRNPGMKALSGRAPRWLQCALAPLRFWWQILRQAMQLWLRRNAFSHAGSLAFYTLFSLAPTVIIAVTVIGLVLGEDAARGQIVAQLQEAMGRGAASGVGQGVARSRCQESGLVPGLRGLGALLGGASTVCGQRQHSLNAIWGGTATPARSSGCILMKSRMLSLSVGVGIGV